MPGVNFVAIVDRRGTYRYFFSTDTTPATAVTEILGKGLEELCLSEDALKLRAAFDACVQSGESQTCLAEFPSVGALRLRMESLASEEDDDRLGHDRFAVLLLAERNPLEFKLSPRETAVLRMLCEGQNSLDIADQLELAESTVATYRERLKKKVGVNSLAGLVRYAVRVGIVDA